MINHQRRTIGVGLISVGWMGRLHSRAYAYLPVVYPELGIVPRLVQAADTATERARYAVDVLGFESATADYREVLNNPEVEVVSICAPNFLHKDIALAAAAAGKPYWIEKPAGRGADETEELVQTAAASGVVTAVGFNYRNAPAVDHVKRLVADGTLGRITNVRGAFFADYASNPQGALSWRFVRRLAGSGVLADLMGHLVDLMHYIVGPIAAVGAMTSTVHTSRPELPMGSGSHFAVVEDGAMKAVENEDYAALLVRFGDAALGAGAVGTLEASRVTVGPRAGYGVEIYGTHGSVIWDFERMNELQVALGYQGPHVGYTRVMANAAFGEFSRFQPGAGSGMGYDDLKVVEAKKFLSAYLGQEPGQADVRDALAAARVTAAAEESAATGSWAPVGRVHPSSAAIRGSRGQAGGWERAE